MKNRRKCVFMPDDGIKAAWDFLIGICLLTWCFLIPLNLAIGPNSSAEADKSNFKSIGKFEIAIDIIFCIDICFCFMTASYDKFG
jgi:hypothetical protein